MKKILYILFLLVLICPFCAAIQEEKKISLEDAINLALKTNPQIELARLDMEISKNNIKKAGRLQNPSLEFFQNIPKAGAGNPQNIGLDYTIEVLKRGKRKNTARALNEAASDSQKFLEFALIAEVKKSYINFLVKKSYLKIIKEQENLARELYNEMKKENLPESEVIQAKIALNRAVMYSNIAQKEVISAQNYFNSVLNAGETNYNTMEDELLEDYSELLAISPKEDIFSFEEIKKYAISNRYDLQKARKEINAAKCRLDEIKSQKIPDIELTGGYAYQTKGMSEDKHFQSGGYIGASLVNLPVLHTFKPEIQNGEIEIKKAELHYKDIEIDAVRNLTDAYEKYQIARKNLNFYNEKILSDSKNLMVASKKNLQEKKIDFSAFLISKRLYLELMLGYKSALCDYYSSIADLLCEMNAASINESL